jgi:hypothetical protein
MEDSKVDHFQVVAAGEVEEEEEEEEEDSTAVSLQ